MGSAVSSTGDFGVFLKGLVGGVIARIAEAICPGRLNQENIQGDIILGLPKKYETFYFYKITDVERFRRNLSELVPMITTMKQVVGDRNQISDMKKSRKVELLPLSGTNIAFSQVGLQKLGKSDDLADGPFKMGQKAQAEVLGDPTNPKKPSEPNWIPEFKDEIDLVILITGATPEVITEREGRIGEIFGINTSNASVNQVLSLKGNVRPGDQKGHEHFGYLDGISQPGVDRFTVPNPGQDAVPAGIALCGNVGDPLRHHRPGWATDGSFLVFRYLEQLVPEFDDFCMKHPIVAEGLSQADGAALAGARMVGRWKSGAPIDVTPLKDDPDLAKDPKRNNKFDFSTDSSQDKCPYAAHIRKSNPRSDLNLLGGTLIHRIWRQGIPYGPEVTADERQQAKTLHSRGLCFVCYQSNIEQGFSFIQQSWCNNINFPPKLIPSVTSGFDPIMGLNGNKPREMLDPKAAGMNLKLPLEFVVPKGGEYFFSPSLKTLRDDLALKV